MKNNNPVDYMWSTHVDVPVDTPISFLEALEVFTWLILGSMFIGASAAFIIG